MDFPVNLERAFAPLGGRLQREPERDLWVFDLDDYVLRVEPFLLRPKARLIVGLDCTVVHKEFSDLIARILQKSSKQLQALESEQLTKDTTSIDGAEAEYREMVENKIHKIQSRDFAESLKRFRESRPDKPSMPQIRHLAALAWVGDFSTLMDYQNTFRRGFRLNFVPMISQEMIDRATEIALERASKR